MSKTGIVPAQTLHLISNGMKIHKGDTVVVRSGKDRGKTGTVLRAFPKTEKVLVEGINMVKRHQRSNRRGQAGQIIERAMPIHVSNLGLKGKGDKPVRVGYSVEDGKKTRVQKPSGEKV